MWPPAAGQDLRPGDHLPPVGISGKAGRLEGVLLPVPIFGPGDHLHPVGISGPGDRWGVVCRQSGSPTGRSLNLRTSSLREHQNLACHQLPFSRPVYLRVNVMLTPRDAELLMRGMISSSTYASLTPPIKCMVISCGA